MAILGKGLIEDIIRGETRRLFHEKVEKAELALLRELYKGLSREVAKLRIPKRLIEGRYIRLSTSVRVEGLSLTKSLPSAVPIPYGNYRHEVTTLTPKQKELAGQWKQLCKERDDFRNSLRAVLSGIRTTKQLEEVVPEVAKYVSKPSTQVTALVPAEKIKEVRTALQTKTARGRS